MLCVDPSKRLTAAHVLAHPWMEDCAQAHEETYNQNNGVFRQLQLDEGSFSIASVDRNQDFSFGEGSPTTADGKLWHSTAFTCKSSFSSFLDENCTSCPASGGFSFRSCIYESSPTEFSSPVSSMPSFTFFSPSYAAEQENIHRDLKPRYPLWIQLLESQMLRNYLIWYAHQLSVIMENLNARTFEEEEQMGSLGSPGFTTKGIIQLDLDETFEELNSGVASALFYYSSGVIEFRIMHLFQYSNVSCAKLHYIQSLYTRYIVKIKIKPVFVYKLIKKRKITQLYMS